MPGPVAVSSPAADFPIAVNTFLAAEVIELGCMALAQTVRMPNADFVYDRGGPPFPALFPGQRKTRGRPRRAPRLDSKLSALIWTAGTSGRHPRVRHASLHLLLAVSGELPILSFTAISVLSATRRHAHPHFFQNVTLPGAWVHSGHPRAPAPSTTAQRGWKRVNFRYCRSLFQATLSV